MQELLTQPAAHTHYRDTQTYSFNSNSECSPTSILFLPGAILRHKRNKHPYNCVQRKTLLQAAVFFFSPSSLHCFVLVRPWICLDFIQTMHCTMLVARLLVCIQNCSWTGKATNKLIELQSANCFDVKWNSLQVT